MGSMNERRHMYKDSCKFYQRLNSHSIEAFYYLIYEVQVDIIALFNEAVIQEVVAVASAVGMPPTYSCASIFGIAFLKIALSNGIPSPRVVLCLWVLL